MAPAWWWPPQHGLVWSWLEGLRKFKTCQWVSGRSLNLGTEPRTAKIGEAQDWPGSGEALKPDYFLLACTCTHTFACTHAPNFASVAELPYSDPLFHKKRMSVAFPGSHTDFLQIPELLPFSQSLSGLGVISVVPKSSWHDLSQGLEVLENRSHDRLFEIPYSTFKEIYT